MGRPELHMPILFTQGSWEAAAGGGGAPVESAQTKRRWLTCGKGWSINTDLPQ